MPYEGEVLERASKAEQLLGSPIALHARQLITLDDDKLWMPFRIGAETYYIPEVNVGTSEEPLGISYLDLSNVRNPRLAESVAERASFLIAARAPKIVAKMGSHKSEWVTEEATRRASRLLGLETNIEVVWFPTSRIEDEVRKEIGADGVIVSYKPVTLPEGKLKYMGLSRKNRDRITSVCPNGRGFLIFDDAGTTFKTVRAAEEHLGLTEDSEHHVSLVIRESPEDNDDPQVVYPLILPPRVHTMYFSPEVAMEAGDAHMLHEPDAIPQAR